MTELHRQGLEFPFVKDELPLYAEKFGGEPVNMGIKEEAAFLSRCNKVKAFAGLKDMLDVFSKEGIPMYVLSNSGFRAGALQMILDSLGIGKHFEKVWSSADYGRVKPDTGFFETAVSEILKMHPDTTRDDILFTGDTYGSDITGAHYAGLRSAWINRKNASDVNGFAVFQIKDVTELLKLAD
jgi:putative hydrolase of the HAD superfamily